MNLAVKTMPIARKNTKLKKTQRQPSAAIRMPESVGPTTGATMMTRAVVPIAAPILCGGTTSMTIANMIGSTMPVPMPWMQRPTRAPAKVDEKPLISAPTAKAPKANRVSLRAGNHLVSRLEKGRTRPMTSM